MRRSPALFAWLLCGTLDIVYAAVSSVVQGGTVSSMLHAVASGPFGAAARSWGIGGDIAGLATHYAIMGAMVACVVFVGAALARADPRGHGGSPAPSTA